MGENSAIEWCHHTFNPFWGCSHVSPGCVSCYAETWAKRTGFDVWGAQGERRLFGPDHWREPLAWNAVAERDGERRRVFCASMADAFEDHPQLPPERARLWSLIEATPWLDWLLLTKRIENVVTMVPESWSELPDNVWIGTSVENQEWADRRVPILLQIPALVRFLSCEPLIGPVDLGHWLEDHYTSWEEERIEQPSVSWVICGGESGGHARRMSAEWARSLRDQCRSHDIPETFEGVPFFFKQAGSVLAREWGLKDAKGGDISELPLDLRIREFPAPVVTATDLGRLL